MKKLSKKQQELVDAMRTGVVVHYMEYMGSFNPKPYYYRSDNFNRVTAAAQGLIDKGYAKKEGKYRDFKLALLPTA